MKTLDDKESFFFIHLHLFTTGIGKWGVKPLIERFDGIEDFGQHEIEQCPQFWQIVLSVSLNFNKQFGSLPVEEYQSKSTYIESCNTR